LMLLTQRMRKDKLLELLTLLEIRTKDGTCSTLIKRTKQQQRV
jgi:hypothetical protein